MIGPGWLPRYRPLGLRRPTLAYNRRRRRSQPRGNQAPRTASSHPELVQFDRGPAEFPVAMIRPREPRARMVALAAGLQRWLVARWQWFRPRTVPVAVAALGMIAVLKSADYLAHHHGDPAPNARVVHIDLAPR
jgi:hypothetical protein